MLIEADGSNCKPIKFPNSTEPVLYENVEEIVVVCGLQALGRPLIEVAHRPEQFQCFRANLLTGHRNGDRRRTPHGRGAADPAQ